MNYRILLLIAVASSPAVANDRSQVVHARRLAVTRSSTQYHAWSRYGVHREAGYRMRQLKSQRLALRRSLMQVRAAEQQRLREEQQKQEQLHAELDAREAEWQARVDQDPQLREWHQRNCPTDWEDFVQARRAEANQAARRQREQAGVRIVAPDSLELEVGEFGIAPKLKGE